VTVKPWLYPVTMAYVAIAVTLILAILIFGGGR
jgi:hypothetical protein